MGNETKPPHGPPVVFVAQPRLAEWLTRLVGRLRREKRSAIIWVDPATNTVRVFDAVPAGRMELD